MRFAFVLMGVELFAVEFACPSRGIYEVPCPDYFDAAEWESEDGVE